MAGHVAAWAGSPIGSTSDLAGMRIRAVSTADASAKNIQDKDTLVLEPSDTEERVSFDARDYSLIDLRWITDNWILLMACGRALTIVMVDGSQIELQNFFPRGLTAAEDNATDVMVQVGEKKFLSAAQFAERFSVTRTCSNYEITAGSGSGTGGSGSAESNLYSRSSSYIFSDTLELNQPGLGVVNRFCRSPH